ncbi:MAG TPA: hypothetical protein VJJ24_03115 [Candidatus Paceibacterota bacterium]
MWKIWTVFALGFFVILVPFLGLPPTADLVLFLISGLAIMVLSFVAARDFYLELSKKNGPTNLNSEVNEVNL